VSMDQLLSSVLTFRQATDSPLAALVATFRLAQACYRKRDYQASYEALCSAWRVPLPGPIAHQVHGFLAYCMACVLWGAGRPEEAVRYARYAVRTNPHHACSHRVLGEILLALGTLPEAWTHHEWREPACRRRFTAPRWDSRPLKGKTLLVWAEQGYGDTLQFSRFLPSLAAVCGGRVITEVQPALVRLLSQCSGVEVISTTPESFDYHCPLHSQTHLGEWGPVFQEMWVALASQRRMHDGTHA